MDGDNNKMLDTFKWSPKGYTIKSGKRAALIRISPLIQLTKMVTINFLFSKKISNVNIKLNTMVTNLNMNNRTYKIKGKSYKFDILINTISPDTLFNFKFGELKYIGRDLLKIVFPVEEFSKRCFFSLLS